MIVFIYLLAVVGANLAVAQFGPVASIPSAFFFIALDITSRDALHERWEGKGLFLRMLALIVAGSALSWLLNRDAERIALASATAFALSGTVDTLSYWALGDRARYIRVNGSNVLSAAVDSIAFPILAFGFPLMPLIMAGQFLAKTVGGLLWYALWQRVERKEVEHA